MLRIYVALTQCLDDSSRLGIVRFLDRDDNRHRGDHLSPFDRRRGGPRNLQNRMLHSEQRKDEVFGLTAHDVLKDRFRATGDGSHFEDRRFHRAGREAGELAKRSFFDSLMRSDDAFEHKLRVCGHVKARIPTTLGHT